MEREGVFNAASSQMAKESFSSYLRMQNYPRLVFSEHAISNPSHITVLNSYFKGNVKMEAFVLDKALTGKARRSFQKLIKCLLDNQGQNLQELSLQNEVPMDNVVCLKINRWLKSREGLIFKFTGILAEDRFQNLFDDSENDLKFNCLELGDVTIRSNFFFKLYSLTELSLNHTGMSPAAWEELCVFIGENEILERFTSVRNIENETDAQKAIALGQAIGKNKSLKSLEIIQDLPKLVKLLLDSIEDNDSLEHFGFKFLHNRKKNLGEIVSAMNTALEEGRVSLCTVDIAGHVLSTQSLCILTENIMKKDLKLKSEIENIVEAVNKDATVPALEFKSWVYGSGSKLFMELFPLRSPTQANEPNFRTASSYDSVLLKSRPSTGEPYYYINATMLFPVDVCNSSQHIAHSMFSALATKELDKTESRVDLKQSDILSHFAQNAVDVAKFPEDAGKQQLKRLNNCWAGLNSVAVGMPVLRSRNDEGIVFVTFVVDELLSANYSREMKKISSIVAKASDSQTVFIVGILGPGTKSRITQSLGFDLTSFKQFLAKEIYNMIPLLLMKKIGKKITNDKNYRDDAWNLVFLVEAPFDNTFLDDQGPLWRSVESTLTEKQVVSRWYILLTLLKAKGPHVSYLEALNEAGRLFGAEDDDINLNLELDADLDEMLKYFDSSGELLLLGSCEGMSESQRNEQLVVLDRFWLNNQFEVFCNRKILDDKAVWKESKLNFDALWPAESDSTRLVLEKYAKDTGLLFEIGANSRCFLPYAVGTPATEEESPKSDDASTNSGKESRISDEFPKLEETLAKTVDPLTKLIESTKSKVAPNKFEDPSTKLNESSEEAKEPPTESAELSEQLNDSPGLFSICIPFHYCQLEFFNLFCGSLLKCAIADEEILDEQNLVLKSEYLEFSLNESIKVWARCDRVKKRIRLGLDEEKFMHLENYIMICRTALKNTLSFFIPNLGDGELFNIFDEDPRTIEQYPHLLLHFVLDDRVWEFPYEAFSGEGAPMGFGHLRLSAKTIPEIDFEQTAKEIASNKPLQPEMPDVTIMRGGSDLIFNQNVPDLLEWLLHNDGFSVNYDASARSKVLVLFLQSEGLTALEQQGENWHWAGTFMGYPTENCFFVVSDEVLVPRGKKIFKDCRNFSRKNQFHKQLQTLVRDISKRLMQIEYGG